jgi:hypothetical protein
MHWNVLIIPHIPQTPPSCDFHAFGPLKKAIMGSRFGLDKDIKAMVVQ